MGKWNGTANDLDPDLVARLIRHHQERPEQPEPPLVRLGPFGEVRYNYGSLLNSELSGRHF